MLQAGAAATALSFSLAENVTLPLQSPVGVMVPVALPLWPTLILTVNAPTLGPV